MAAYRPVSTRVSVDTHLKACKQLHSCYATCVFYERFLLVEIIFVCEQTNIEKKHNEECCVLEIFAMFGGSCHRRFILFQFGGTMRRHNQLEVACFVSPNFDWLAFWNCPYTCHQKGCGLSRNVLTVIVKPFPVSEREHEFTVHSMKACRKR